MKKAFEIPVDVGQKLYSYNNGLVEDTVISISYEYAKASTKYEKDKFQEQEHIIITLGDGTQIYPYLIGSAYFTSKGDLLKHITDIIL